MKHEYGIVVLLDALGTRNASIEDSKSYLKAIETIHSEFMNVRSFTAQGPYEIDKETKRQLETMEPKFFGDSILMTCNLHNPNELCEYFDRMTFIISVMMVKALELGILFRGAVSIGEYIKKETVALGPAITDVASWYEKLEMVGVMCTPACSTRIKQAYLKKRKSAFNEDQPTGKAFGLDQCPLKSGVIKTYMLYWPFIIEAFAKKESMDSLEWYYDRIAKLEIPMGTESKYSNTELFVKKCLSEAI